MSRQRLRPSLGESSHIPCPRCDGQGTIRGIESLALSVLRILEEEAMKDLTAKVVAQLPVEAATFLLNEKRQPISEIEHRLDVEIIIVPSPALETPQYNIQRIRLSETANDESGQASYKLTPEMDATVQEPITGKAKRRIEEPAIKQIIPDKPAPVTKGSPSEKAKGLISRLFGSLFGIPDKEQKEQESRRMRNTQHRRRPNRGRGSRSREYNRDQASRNSKSDNRQSRNENRSGKKSGNENKRFSSDKQRTRRGGRRRYNPENKVATKRNDSYPSTSNDEIKNNVDSETNLINQQNTPESDSISKSFTDIENSNNENIIQTDNAIMTTNTSDIHQNTGDITTDLEPDYDEDKDIKANNPHSEKLPAIQNELEDTIKNDE
jgi:ribonuclease E